MGATYLVRFDDICPTMNWAVWRQVERVLLELDIKPILAVVPDNCDPELEVQPAQPHFWSRVRTWQARGWTIGMHGYQHRYETHDAGIIGRNRYSEFAGLPRRVQDFKLRKAASIFEREGVTPDAWIAPAHSFDQSTLAVLADLGIRRISDGYALRPHKDGQDMVWVPQQMARFRWMPGFVWTVCLHHNGWGVNEVLAFERTLHRYRSRIVSFEDVAERYGSRQAGLIDRLSESAIRAMRSLRVVAEGVR